MPSDVSGLFPVTTPFSTEKIDVGNGHVLYVQQHGDRGGVPVVFLHGGPGSGCNNEQARLFDPKRYRIILFDQRGAGLSTPKRGLSHNTTQHLVADMNTIRIHLDLERWIVVGGSWGATLALAYAQAHPCHVLGIVLRATFLGTTDEVIWAFEKAAQIFYPDLWRQFVTLLPSSEREHPIESYGARLLNPDPGIHIPAAFVWNHYESALSSLEPNNLNLPDTLNKNVVNADSIRPNTPYIEWHYIKNNCFLAHNQLINNAQQLSGIPGIIIQGRYDLLCPPVTAARLASLWTDAELRIVPGSGHSASEPKIQTALIEAAADIYDKRLRS